MNSKKELEGFVKLAARDNFINPFEELSTIKVKAKHLIINLNKERKTQNVRKTKTSNPSKRS